MQLVSLGDIGEEDFQSLKAQYRLNREQVKLSLAAYDINNTVYLILRTVLCASIKSNITIPFIIIYYHISYKAL